MPPRCCLVRSTLESQWTRNLLRSTSNASIASITSQLLSPASNENTMHGGLRFRDGTGHGLNFWSQPNAGVSAPLPTATGAPPTQNGSYWHSMPKDRTWHGLPTPLEDRTSNIDATWHSAGQPSALTLAAGAASLLEMDPAHHAAARPSTYDRPSVRSSAGLGFLHATANMLRSGTFIAQDTPVAE